MTRTVYLHVGSPKSGTTYLQRVLDGNRTVLADQGVLVVGRDQGTRVQAALQVREDPRWEKLPADRRDQWGRLVKEIRDWSGPSAILSYELFSAASAEQAARAIGDLAGLDVHVVITARDLARSVPSAWQERLKFGLTTPLEDWKPPKAEAPRSEWGWRTTDPTSVAERWGAGLAADHVHVVTVPRSPADPTELWRRFGAACGIADAPVDLDLPRVNESLGAVGAELLRRVNERLGAPLDNSREKARWLRDTLAHRVIAPRQDQPLAMTDRQYDEAQARAEQAIATLAASGHVVHGDLDDLRATRPSGRLSGEVSDAEVLDAALDALRDLLLLWRADTTGEAGEGSASAGAATAPAGGRLRRIAQRVAAPAVDRSEEQLRRRITELEAEVAKSRALHQRVAMLQDVVTELLLPADLADGDVTGAALRTYRADSL
ncbi:DUF6752 domain-containing protein [Pimelobacter simplex]|uniref:DUF6752 domain-containing protein n=1 Tax=Nocardioides simplex TaxID=2045 RepID=UPI00214F950B|nr:DUF6752 domain-containing protein [Pimelobacter simplex]UUW87072.1 hypothetical protein M0M43_15095 [Pimelobacter simplex]UUW96578.1 hypothetical protein M0M48_03730 [Pimelobacter simplex]